MRKPIIVLAFLLLFFLFGCITEKTIDAPVNEFILLTTTEDFDNDGSIDIKNYIFKPIIIDVEQNLIMQKAISIAQVETSLNIKSIKNYTDSDISNLESLIFQFDNERTDMENICRDAFGINKIIGNSCESPEVCANLCITAQCKKYSYVHELIGYWIYDFSQNSRAMDEDIRNVKNSIITLKNVPENEKKRIMQKLNAIIDRTNIMNTNLLFNNNVFGICKQISYNNNKIISMLDIMGQYERQPIAYIYVTNLKFTFGSKDYGELKITDNIPKSLIPSLRNITLSHGSTFNKNTNQITWPVITFNLYPKYVLSYSFRTMQNIDENIAMNWPTSNAYLKTISVEKNQLIGYAIEISKQIYLYSKGLGYYPALAIIGMFWDIVIFTFILCGKIGLNVMRAIFASGGIKNNIIKSFGNAIPHTKRYFVIAIFLFVVGFGLFFNTIPVSEDVFEYKKISKHLTTDLFGSFSVISFFLALHIFCMLFVNEFKGMVIGRRYYEKVLNLSPRANRLRFNALKEQIDVLKERIIASKNINVSEEKEALISIPLERIEELLERFGSEWEVKELIEKHAKQAEIAIANIDEKTNIIKEYWPTWNNEITKKLAEHGGFAFIAMSDIPSRWRVWAANKFIAEHEGEGIYIDAEGIKKTVVPTVAISGIDLLKKLASRNMIFGGIIMSKGNIHYAYSIVGNQTLEAILSWRISNYAKTLGEKVFNSDYKNITIYGTKNIIVFIKEQNKEGAIFAQTEKISDVLAEFQETLKKLYI